MRTKAKPLGYMACDGNLSHHTEYEQWEESALGKIVHDPWRHAVQHRRIDGHLDHGAAHPADLLSQPLRKGIGCVGLDDCVWDMDYAIAGSENLCGKVPVFVRDLQVEVSMARCQL